MATITQYFNAGVKNRRIKNYYYVCGDSQKGIELVLADILKFARPRQHNVHTWDMRVDTFRDVYLTFKQFSVHRRILIVREAQRLEADHWQLITESAHVSGTVLIMVTNERMPRKGPHKAAYTWFREHGRVIICNQLRDREVALNFLTTYLHVSEICAEHIIDIAGLKDERVLFEAERLKLAGVKSVRDVDAMITPPKHAARKLVERDRSLAKVVLDDAELLAFLQEVEQDVLNQTAVIGLARKNLKPFEIQQRIGVELQDFRSLVSRSARTNGNQIAEKLEVLSALQHEYHYNDARKGVFEVFMRKWRNVR